MRFHCRNLVLTLVLISLAGCGSSSQDVSQEQLAQMAGGKLADVVSVTGTVSIDGKPTAGINLYLHDKSNVRVRQTRTDSQGKYCWSTNVQCDGLEPGSYKITFRHIPEERDNESSEATDDLFKGRYSSAKKSTYTLNVEANKPASAVDYDLKSK
jgi:hypothetical protein